ncbi:MAG: acyltransferase family protein, partial [Phycisphaerales bacterium JB060]
MPPTEPTDPPTDLPTSQPTTQPTLVASSTDPRRHDLDALRAGAMLLGIVLHASLSFFDNPMWPVQDASRAPALALVVMAIHGFRMPLFFLLSGYFTAMLARRRGLGGLLRHRGKRIALPLAVGMATIVPLVWAVSIWGYTSPTLAVTGAAPTAETSIWVAAGEGDLDALRRHLDEDADPNELDPAYRVTPLAWAVVADRTDAVAMLLEAGADPGVRYADGNTPLHTACFFGRADVARLLVDAGAPVDARSLAGETPADVMRYDRATTEGVARAIRTEIDFDQVSAGREEIRTFLPDAPAAEPTGFSPAMLRGLLFEFPVFHHLWFLWFLCWLVPGYALAELLLRRLPGVRLPRAVTILAAPPVCLLWLVPLTMLAQWPMTSGGIQPGFGPDTSVGLLPIPRVLAYYAVFFGAGAMLFTARGGAARLGRGWWLTLPLALAVLAPAMSLGLKTP